MMADAHTTVSRDSETEITLSLTPTQAGSVATALLADTATRIDEVGTQAEDLIDRANFDAIRSLLDSVEPLLDRIGWGTPARDVELTLTDSRWRQIVLKLMYVGADHASVWPDDVVTDLPACRFDAREIAAGCAIYDQLEAVTGMEEAER